ncbi:MAG: hypothetical protein ACMX3H_04250 [Sodalis sp. (in: enterobacteria)]|uniref:hypothetical protein n=1 Tax=Sodalis sp. (in: enterobacteria) TaxID=1898979 RepID=UPI0039E397DA
MKLNEIICYELKQEVIALPGRLLLSLTENDPLGLRWLTPLAPQGRGRLPGWPQQALVTAASHYALDQRDDECRRVGGGSELRHSRPENFFFQTLRMTKRLLKTLKKTPQ